MSRRDALVPNGYTSPPTITNSVHPEESLNDKRPGLLIHIFDSPAHALVDSGASVSAVSEQFFKSLTQNVPEGRRLSVLPVTGVTITTAVKSRSRKITKQTLIPFTVAERTCDCICLVVPHLATSVILGSDWLSHHKVDIRYSLRLYYFPSWDCQIPFTDYTQEFRNQVNTFFTITVAPQDNVKSAPDHCIASVEVVSQYIEPTLRSSEINSFQISEDHDLEPLSNIMDHISSISVLSSEQLNQVNMLFQQYHKVFRNRPGLNSLYTCKFNTTEDVPFKVRPYPVPFSRRPAVEKELTRMLDWGVIERCSSPYGNPIICVGKADGTVRLCLDARRINQMILPMRDSSPPLDELLARFGGKTMFSSIDFNAGYWQISLHQDVRKYTAFIYGGRTYQFCVVPFGLNISNTAFQQALEVVLSHQSEDCDDEALVDLHVYVDDVLVSSTSFEDHLHRLKVLLHKIWVSGMTLKFSKCIFFP